MAQTGTGKARDKKVMRALVDEHVTVDVWYPEDPGFILEPPAVFLRPEQGATFGERGSAEGDESRSGSWNFLGFARNVPGVDMQMDAIEQMVRAIASTGRTDADTEDIWTTGAMETHEDVAPGGLPKAVEDAYRIDQYIVPYSATEVGR